MILITAGRARSSILLPSGEEHILSVSGPGDVLGEISLLTGARRPATVTALTPLRGWTLDRHGSRCCGGLHATRPSASLLCFSGFPQIQEVSAVVEQVPVRFAERGETAVGLPARGG